MKTGAYIALGVLVFAGLWFAWTRWKKAKAKEAETAVSDLFKNSTINEVGKVLPKEQRDAIFREAVKQVLG